jgi:hypothetical protein
MIRRLLAAVVLAAVVTLTPQHAVNAQRHPGAQTTQLAMFPTEAAAQRHCPRDEVVWLNVPSGIYHEKGMRWYGRTKYGAYVCRKEADAAGDRDTRNGQ